MSVTHEISLNCLILGDDSNRMFKVQVAQTADVSDLKKLIKRERGKSLRSTDANDLDLYQVSLLDDAELDEKLRHPTLNAPLHSEGKLSTYFKHMPGPDVYIHILAKQHDDSIALLQAEKQDRILAALAESFKRATTIRSKSPTPSQVAGSNEYVEIQSGDQSLSDCHAAGNPVNTVAPEPPIQLFNPAFAYFSSKAFDPEYNVPRDFVRNARNLVAQFSSIHTNKEARQRHLRPFLQKAIHHPLTSIHNFDGSAPDVVALTSCGELPVYLVIFEGMNEFGSGGSDPSVRAAASYLRIFNQKQNSKLRQKCCCPAFIMAHAGPLLTIMGGIITTNCVVQRLTDFLWIPLHSALDDDQYYRVARVLYALSQSIQRLTSWYKAIGDVTPLDPSAPSPATHPLFFPSPDTYRYDDALVKFAYQELLGRNISCTTYLAKTIGDSPKDIVVKFVTSYGVDAHRKMALAGFAPRLFYYGLIDVTPDMPSYGDLRMVVMEHVKGLTLEDALKQRKVPPRFNADLRRALEQLHSTGYVFGDLRQQNVIVTPEGTSTAQLIGFNWAGKEGEVKYPLSIPGSIDWPVGVLGLAFIRKEHDLAMLDSLASHLPQC